MPTTAVAPREMMRPRSHAVANNGLPLGHRTPRGRLRWYLVQVPEGRERSICEQVRRLVPPTALEDAFVPAKERWMKRAGRSFTTEILMYRGFFFAQTADVIALDKELGKLTFPVRIVGSGERAWVPLDDAGISWILAAMDSKHVIRSSTAHVVDGELRVIDGPLVGQEGLVTKVDRRKRFCLVRIADGDHVERMPLDVPFKS